VNIELLTIEIKKCAFWWCSE